MKKAFISFFAAALALGFVSCNKENSVEPIGDDPAPTEPTYQEGVYAPLMKVSAITYDDGTAETWTWDGNLLTSVASTGGDTRQFSYNGQHVVGTAGTESGVPAQVSFTYNGNDLAKCVMNNNGTDVMMLTFSHAGGKVSGADVALDAEYISGMLDGLLLKGKGKHVDPKQVFLDANDNCARLDFVWNDKDVAQMVVSGSIPFALTREMYETIKPYLPVDESILSIADMYFLLSPSLPLSINVSDTIDYTYDNKINPYYCYLGEVDPTNFSLHNVLTAISHGKVSISANLFQNPMQLFEQSLGDYKEYSYQYNDRNYPTAVEGSENYTITYKP